MNAHRKIGESQEGSVPALKKSLAEFVDEYDRKLLGLKDASDAFKRAHSDLKTSCNMTHYQGDPTDGARLNDAEMGRILLRSAWWSVYHGLDIGKIAPKVDRDRLRMEFEQNPKPFTLENIRDVFADYRADPRHHILRGLAQTFADLDPFYKSHSKWQVGVKGLPKRIILGGFAGYSSHGENKLADVMRAYCRVISEAEMTHGELRAWISMAQRGITADDVDDFEPGAQYRQGDFAKQNGRLYRLDRHTPPSDKIVSEGTYPAWSPVSIPDLGLKLRVFNNGNGHLSFSPQALRNINAALAEYYGPSLQKDADDDEELKKAPSTAVSADLAFYPTPKKAADALIGGQIDRGYNNTATIKILEPQCGDGRLIDRINAEIKEKCVIGVEVYGVEIDKRHAPALKAKGINATWANFLNVAPTGDFDYIFMNPPFAGKHYQKHVEHAKKFLKPGGVMRCILPASARYDHDFIPVSHGEYAPGWRDLPAGSFSEVGTNVNTGIYEWVKGKD